MAGEEAPDFAAQYARRDCLLGGFDDEGVSLGAPATTSDDEEGLGDSVTALIINPRSLSGEMDVWIEVRGIVGLAHKEACDRVERTAARFFSFFCSFCSLNALNRWEADGGESISPSER
jgi:hypothetical protein